MRSYHLALMGLFILLLGCNDHTVRKQGFEVHGIDVSHYQKSIDWNKVASQDIQFAFIKATEGETYKDSFFCENWAEMKAAGIKRGAYHFFRPTLSAAMQAENFIEMAELGDGDLAPVLDVEVSDGLDPITVRKQVDIWMEIVENHFKTKPILYSYQNFFNDYLAGHYNDYPVWIARYSSWRKPCLHVDQGWEFWQYGNRGQLKGIDGPVDFNVFKGSALELERLCLIRPKPLMELPPLPVDGSVAANP